ncbi:ethanolamine ammonia-lyase reactivating factor EutA [Lysinibacillus antri]|uniref:Ethanolamine utilization protein n=1 Tax=Lysinibacillus antri TaxID=2498145 RepID=A0A432L7L6_9BACI|nr:ethanolamine ammonia-lyase reactivating factor EutA [Lysinibacillus antri]RUL47267.1 ethanolamine utilization protein [Lysinibacillus antri]
MAQQTDTILSAGIDIGTSTTKIIISQLVLQNTAGRTHVPRVEIIDKTVLYKSPIFRTPLLDDTTIDAKQIEQIVFSQYQLANVNPSDIQAGAILITGETATKQNASELIHYLSDAAGEFLVATAGPDLESVLAAKGSGAVTYSKQTSKVIANIDIGGGTTNIAVLKHGEVIGTVTLHLGGRLMEYAQGRLISVAPAIQRLFANHQRTIRLNSPQNPATEQWVIENMLVSLKAVLRGEQDTDKIPLLLGHVPNWSEHIDCLMFSGGVARFLYPELKEVETSNAFDDIGEKIAHALLQDSSLQAFQWLKPLETVRATVTGAGVQSTEVSGSTIEVNEHLLPLKNIPVYTCDFQHTHANIEEKIREAISTAQQLYQIDGEETHYALYLKNIPYLQFHDIGQMAECILQHWSSSNTIIVILESDYAKVLGQTLKRKTSTKNIICIDQIYVNTSDYIDIGKPVHSGVVPVVVKTLAFHKA